MTLRKQIEDLCAKMGANRLLVQGSGGNVSWKEGNELWVKASGTRLGDAKVDNIFVAVCLKSMRENLSARNFDATAHLLGDSTLRPSIETSLHALLPQKVVFHIHAVDVLAYLVKKDHTSYLESIFNGLLNFVSVDYKKPGAELAEAVYDALQTRKGANVIFLANHGIVVGGDSVDQVEKIIALITQKLKKTIPIDPVSGEGEDANVNGYSLLDSQELQQLALNPVLLNRVKEYWPLYPDHVVFLGAEPCIFEGDDLTKILDKPNIADLIFVADKGVYVNKKFSDAKKEQLYCYFDVIVRISQTEESLLQCITPDDIGKLINWDAEKYRMSMVKST